MKGSKLPLARSWLLCGCLVAAGTVRADPPAQSPDTGQPTDTSSTSTSTSTQPSGLSYGARPLGALLPSRGVSWSADGGFNYSDNVLRTSTDRQSQTIAAVGLNLGVHEAIPVLTADVDGSVRVNDYLENAYPREYLKAFTGDLTLVAIPRQLTWTVHDNFGTVAADPYAPETPGNRQDVNYFSTGPDFHLPLSYRTELVLQGRYSKAEFGKSGGDNNQTGGTLSLNHRLAARASTYVQVSTTNYEYLGRPGVVPSQPGAPPSLAALAQAQPGVSSFREDDVYAGLDLTGARTSLSIGGGVTRVRVTDRSDSGLLAKAQAVRKLGTRSELSVDVGTRFSNTGDVFQHDQQALGLSLGNGEAVVSRDPYKMKYADVTLRTIAGPLLNFDVLASWRKEEHSVQTQFNRSWESLRGEATQRLTARLSASLSATYARNQYGTLGLSFDDWVIDSGLSWNLTARSVVQLRYQHYVGGGYDNPNSNYVENRVYLGITYTGRSANAPRR